MNSNVTIRSVFYCHGYVIMMMIVVMNQMNRIAQVILPTLFVTTMNFNVTQFNNVSLNHSTVMENQIVKMVVMNLVVVDPQLSDHLREI